MFSPEFYFVLRDLTAGTIGACSGIVAGQPLDTIKVRLQSAEPGFYRGALDCFVRTVRHEGVLSLYKGMASPLVGNAPLNAIVFGCNGHMNRLLERYFPQSDERRLDPTPEYWRLYAAATWGGIAQCVVCTPVELIKCQMQIQGLGAGLASTAKYSGAWDCARQIYQRFGIGGLYRGWWSTVWRDGPSYGAWFVAFEFTKYYLKPKDAIETPTSTLLIAGGLAGIVTWASTYPFDVIKSVVQTADLAAPRSELTIKHIALTNYNKFGAKWFFTGIVPTLIRAVPVSAVTFLVYEKCLSWMNKKK